MDPKIGHKSKKKMETVVQNKPMFLYKDQEAIERTMKQYQEWAQYLQIGLEEAQKLFDEPLTHEEQIFILSKGWYAVEEILRSRSQFPKADADTLLKLYGKDGSNAKKSLDFAPARFAAVDFDVSNGKITVSSSTVEETTKNNTRYTLSHKQNQALAFSKQLCELYNNALTDGLINRDDTNSVRNVLKKFVEVSLDGETLKPAVKHIAALR